MNSKRLAAMGLIVALSVTAAACGSTEEAVEEVSKVSVQVQNPERGDLSVDTAYIGMVAPEQQVYVIPKTSGTVTETFFKVGDIVKEGDVLFKIDDEAAQLQMASAKASYNTAQAGVTAQSSGARDLQNYQTEQQIKTLRDTLYETDDKIAEMEDSLGDLRDQGGQVSAARAKAQEAADAAATGYYALETQVNDIKKQIEEAAPGTDVEALKQALPELELKLSEAKTGLDTARGAVEQLDGTLASIDAAKTQLKSGIDSAEDGKETINDNLATAEQAYAITQNEIYPESDAASAAQLQAASIGIDSAQMQLDFCTVKAPIGGIVESVSVEKNGMAAAGNVAYIISNKESMTVTFNVTEKAKNALTEGDHVTVERSGATYDGTITEIGTMANMQTKLFQVKASVAGASDSLPSGVTVKVHAATQKDSDKLVIPYDAVYFSGADAYVYCVENDAIVKTPVQVGLMSDTQVIIEEGLSEDSLVVDNWSSKLRNGAEAEIVSINGEEVEAASEEEADVPEETAEPEEEPAAVETEEAE
ncbi:MAG: efflux RND transporter periplasmic adaptor subunit [Clostridiales bacterium]|nr:efflux RND transporter periplasmic adaptor subunit [Clostridiales bacterium]